MGADSAACRDTAGYAGLDRGGRREPDYADRADDQIRQVTDAFRALQQKIPGIRAFEHGVNNSPEGKNLGFTHVYTLTFETPAARDAYLPHPEHAQFGALLQQLDLLADVFVVDYLPEE